MGQFKRKKDRSERDTLGAREHRSHPPSKPTALASLPACAPAVPLTHLTRHQSSAEAPAHHPKFPSSKRMPTSATWRQADQPTARSERSHGEAPRYCRNRRPIHVGKRIRPRRCRCRRLPATTSSALPAAHKHAQTHLQSYTSNCSGQRKQDPRPFQVERPEATCVPKEWSNGAQRGKLGLLQAS